MAARNEEQLFTVAHMQIKSRQTNAKQRDIESQMKRDVELVAYRGGCGRATVAYVQQFTWRPHNNQYEGVPSIEQSFEPISYHFLWNK